MLASIAAFELRKRARLLSTWIYAGVLFTCGFLTMIAAGGAFANVSVGMGSERVYANAPHALNGLITLLCHFGVLITAAVFGQAVQQDRETRCDALFFTTPVSKLSYLGGRFLGAVVFSLFVFSSIALGLWLGTKMPFVERSLFGPGRFSHYLWPYLTSVLPNVIFSGAIFFTLATLGRRMMPVYVGAVVLVIGYLMAGGFLHKLEYKTLAGLVDPFGMNASRLVTEYWTVAEKNTLRVPLTGVFLANRLLWSGVGLALLAFTYVRFRFAHAGTAEKARATELRPTSAASEPASLPVMRPEPGRGLGWLLARMTWLAFVETVKNVYFVVIVLAGVLFLAIAAWQTGSIYGTSTHPVTYAILELAGGSFVLFTLVIITFYAGELVFRERDAGIDQIVDALPVPTWLPFVSKLLALFLVQVVLQGVVLLSGIVIQTVQGHFHYELGLYVKELFGLKLIDYCLLCVLAMTVQALVQHKYVGHFVMVVYYLWTLFMSKLGLEHNLYRFDGAPGYEYSDMNRYGHFLRPVFWFDFYWAMFAVLLAIASNLLWARGTETGLALRIVEARRRFSPQLKVVAALAFASFALAGGFIFYNTNILNKYKTSHDLERERADYEKQYKAIAKVAQPRITDAKVTIDVFPERQALRARGTYALKNKTTEPIRTVYVNLPNEQPYDSLAVGDSPRPTKEDRRLGLYTFELPRPLAPGETTSLTFDLDFHPRGFKNEGHSTAIVENGTFFHSTLLPSLGYQEDGELDEDHARKKYGLQPKPGMADPSDLVARQNTYIGSDADWVHFEATVSTSPDQIAIAPGYLQKEWMENGRRHFSYKMDNPILHFFSVLSARYAVKRDRWNDVVLEIYYHPGHEYDLEQMMRGMKDALAYCSSQFGPYQHRQVRILEFPRYQTYAQSFPNTIPYSESIGFIAKVDPTDPKDIDYPYYVTAHEVAHQWWAHQVIGGNVQGATMLSETLAQYSALMVMKKTFGPEKMKRFLAYELDRYLRARGMEKKKEVPLVRVENQPYIHYQKGSLVMYALQDVLGEETVNRALASFLADNKQKEPPYPTALELLAYLKRAAAPHQQSLIEDLFEHITLYDNRALSAHYHEIQQDGKQRYAVQVKVSARKLRADAEGKEREMPLADWIDIGALDDQGDPIFVEKRKITAHETELSLVLDRPPAQVGIDPLNKLIDRKPDDNLVRAVRE
jgi:hypothetical protein